MGACLVLKFESNVWVFLGWPRMNMHAGFALV